MSQTQSFTSSDKEKDKNPLTPRAKLGHRRVDETGETTYKKVSEHVWKGFIEFCISNWEFFSTSQLSKLGWSAVVGISSAVNNLLTQL